MHLTTLHASAVRGLPRGWNDIAIGERGLVIYGENGVGKSSIVDALEYVLTGNSSLYAVNRQGVNWAQGSTHIRGGPLEAGVRLRHAGADYELSPKANVPDDIREWVEKARRSKFVLRRHMLLKFIEAEPRFRYEQLEPFLDLHSYNALEEKMARAASLWKGAAAQAKDALLAAERSVRQVFGLATEANVDERTLLSAIGDAAGELGMTKPASADEFSALAVAVVNELGTNDRQSRLASLVALKTKAQHLPVTPDLSPTLERLGTALVRFEQETAARDGVAITEFLVRGREIIASQDHETCPICEQHIATAEVLSRLDTRIREDEAIATAKSEYEAARAAAKVAVESADALFKEFLAAWSSTVAQPLPDSYEANATLLAEAAERLGALIDSRALSELAARFAATLASHDEAIGTLDGEIDQEGGGGHRRRLLTVKAMIDAWENEWVTYRTAERRVEVTSVGRDNAERLVGHAIEARKAAVQELLGEVSTSANELYEKLHPGERLNKSHLFVRPTEDGSVILQSDFYGVQAPPLLYLSESHLDTLGLCYFLALRRREAEENTAFKVLVLDDIIHSVDAAHRVRFANLLRGSFGDHQIIITTHDRTFYERLRDTLGTAGFKYLSFSGWDIDNGPVSSDPTTDIDRVTVAEIRNTLAPEVLAAACGRFFEWLLRQLTERLEVNIPARFERKQDIGSMWPALAKKLKSRESFIAPNSHLVDDIAASVWIRNEIGGHAGESAAAVTPNEVLELATNISKLFHATRCDTCVRFIKKVGQVWTCDCGEVTYSE